MTIFVKLINVYQKYFSPDHSAWGKGRFPNGYCQFYPSCSEYGKQSLQKYGALKGGWLLACRILKCNPFSQGGLDPVK
ncbi:membrane protein insertion efficiency factor YidD [bacterium]|nr:MAG: membrane protein insertion efficiency factor YidD [bacterium]